MDRFQAASRSFFEAHQEDPRTVHVNGQAVPLSVRYHQRLLSWVERLDPSAPETLRLAALCQHIRRWELPRDQYEANRTGYKRWRADLAQRHAEEAGRILQTVGYDQKTIKRVQSLLKKLRLKQDEEVQRFEDAICLTFIETELESFAQKHEEPKLIDIIQKTWAKMSPQGHEAALALVKTLPEPTQALLTRAL